MKYTVLTLFPEIIDAFFRFSILGKAVEQGLVEYRSVNIRDFAFDRHKTCDDAPYGGGPGMLMKPEPLGRALEAVGIRPKDESPRTGARAVYLSPSGRPFTQAEAERLACAEELVLLCGRYEGIDERIIERYIDDEVSIGDYVLSCGETAAMAVIDATYRLGDRVISPESLAEESFSGGLLEYPQYTRPEVYAMLAVPEILLSGHQENIRRWRLAQRVKRTFARRPDLIRKGAETGLFDKEIRAILEELETAEKTEK
ncbi:MAG: tRNA (guanosine(37)-N1)-methyltransferase TrmD [Spirochaetaceae bacterium]|jgi:tRNA (guanine37-N1)-methyltransferase|nr:tRNA (guanosine(37)-N1)-methyltransferase TrmD [Spirochaetaceae bacterium]